MMRNGFFLLLLGLCLGGPAAAQSVPRIKAKLVSFEGNLLTVMPEGEKQSMKIGVRPATRILQEEQKTFADIQSGDYIGAVLTKTPQGAFNAQEVHIFPPALKGSGEGLYPATPGSSRFILNGTVTGTAASTLTVKFRGASGDGAKCTGRAPVIVINGCEGNATVTVEKAAPVIALAAADKSLLVPGAVLAISIMAGPDGKPVTPGLTIESVATPPVPLPPAVTPERASPPGKKSS
jgi:hypothetical protein